MSECLTTKQPCITATGTTPKQLVNTVRVSSATSAGEPLNPVVCYARKIVVSADELAIGDAIILHSLGVLWDHCHI
jgi:hypothetical protein